MAERVAKVWERRGSDAAADEQAAADVEAVAVAERPRMCKPIAGLQRAERPRARAIGSIRKASSPAA